MSFDNLWFEKVWIYLFIYLFIIIIIILWGVLACGFNWVCLVLCFYGTNVGFELGGGVQYGYDCVV